MTESEALIALHPENADGYSLIEGKIVNGIAPGFVMAPFNLVKDAGTALFTIINESDNNNPASSVNRHSENLPDFPFDIPAESTLRSQHRNEIEQLLVDLKTTGGKTIAARAIVTECVPDFWPLFETLVSRYPDAYVYCCNAHRDVTIFGASPELLLRSKYGILETMALAGTRGSSTPESTPWSSKDIEEQKIVTDFIVDTFKRFGMRPEAGETYTKKAGPVEHICTPVKALSMLDDADALLEFLKALSPTPALCGMPRDISMKRITRLEDFQRGYYGGFCGLYESPANFDFHVILRSGIICSNRTVVFAGGGITAMSDPDSEWLETEAKASTLLTLLQEGQTQ